jgi:hypothetical protein
MSIYWIILAIHYTFSENQTFKILCCIWKACQISCSLSFHRASIAFTSGDDQFDSAFLMIKTIKTELRSTIGSWWLDDKLHWARDIDIQKS